MHGVEDVARLDEKALAVLVAFVRSAGTAVAQKALRHSDVRLTIHTYGHLDVEDVRAGIAKMTNVASRAGAPSPLPSPPLRGGEGDGPGTDLPPGSRRLPV